MLSPVNEYVNIILPIYKHLTTTLPSQIIFIMIDVVFGDQENNSAFFLQRKLYLIPGKCNICSGRWHVCWDGIFIWKMLIAEKEQFCINGVINISFNWIDEINMIWQLVYEYIIIRHAWFFNEKIESKLIGLL